MSNLVYHARRELEACGQFESDPAYAQSIVAAVAALASYGHSGGSMGCAIGQLTELLQFRNLSPLTDRPGEWVEVGYGLWQCSRNGSAFSADGGRTYTLQDDEQKSVHTSLHVEPAPEDDPALSIPVDVDAPSGVTR